MADEGVIKISRWAVALLVTVAGFLLVQTGTLIWVLSAINARQVEMREDVRGVYQKDQAAQDYKHIMQLIAAEHETNQRQDDLLFQLFGPQKISDVEMWGLDGIGGRER